VDHLPDDLAAWDAAALRRRERSLSEQSLASSTLAGLCLDAAERRAEVAFVLQGGAGVRSGVITAVGADYVGLGEDVLIPFAAVSAVRGAVSGDRSSSARLSFAAAVAALADEPVDVSVVVFGGETVSGLLRAVADGVVLIDTTWVVLDAIVVLTIGG
jgi:hypothetical protein